MNYSEWVGLYMTDGKCKYKLLEKIRKWVGWVTDETVDLLSFCLQETVSERISEKYKVLVSHLGETVSEKDREMGKTQTRLMYPLTVSLH
jgi:hypothetical protein